MITNSGIFLIVGPKLASKITNSTQQVWQQSIEQRQSILESRLDNALTNNDYNWLFKEVRYWLELAQQRMNTDANKHAVIGLLKSAKLQLSVLDWSEAAIIQQAIERDLKQLTKSDSFDKSAYFNEFKQTQSIVNKAIKVSTKAPDSNQQEQAKQPLTQSDRAWYELQHIWQKSREFMAQYVSVSNVNSGNEYYISRQQRAIFSQKVDLQFEQAKYALLTDQWSLFESLLEGIITSLDIFDATTQQQWLNQLLVTAKQRPIGEQLILESPVVFQQQMKLLNIRFDHE